VIILIYVLRESYELGKGEYHLDSEKQVWKVMSKRLFENGILPFENQVLPFEKGVLPFEKGVPPFEKGVLPFEKRLLPFEKGVLPFEKGVVPFEKGVVPFEKGVLPFVKGVLAFHVLTKTFNNIISHSSNFFCSQATTLRLLANAYLEWDHTKHWDTALNAVGKVKINLVVQQHHHNCLHHHLIITIIIPLSPSLL
jgi:hypothetical protein